MNLFIFLLVFILIKNKIYTKSVNTVAFIQSFSNYNYNYTAFRKKYFDNETLIVNQTQLWINFTYSRPISILVKDFRDPILKVDIKWFFDRVYVLTKSIDNETLSLYEVDLNYRFIAKLDERNYSIGIDEVHLLSKPTSGFVAYSTNDEVTFIPMHYFEYLNLKENVYKFDEFQKTGSFKTTCKLPFNQDLMLKAYLSEDSADSSVYFISKLNDTVSCKYYLNTSKCQCDSMNDKTRLKILSAYKYNNTTIETFLMQKTSQQECLRKCYSFTKPESLFKFSISSYPRFLSTCPIAGLQTTNLGKISLKRNNLSQILMKIDYKNYQLSSCQNLIETQFNLNYKFIIYIKKVKDESASMSHDLKINGYDEKQEYYIHSKNIFNTKFNFKLNSNSTSSAYLVELHMQSLFEVPKRLETFFINTTTEIEHIIEPTLYISDFEKNFIIKHHSVDIRLIVPANKSLQNLSVLLYLLVNQRTNSVQIIKIENATLENEYDLSILKFTIYNLAENTAYKIRILQNKTQNIISLSNLVEFKTLEIPKLKNIHVGLRDIIDTISIRCHYFLRDYDSFYDNHFHQSERDPFICYKYRYIWTQEGTNITFNESDKPYEEEISFFQNQSSLLIYETRYFLIPNEDKNEFYHFRNISMSNLNEDTNYVINLKVEYLNGFKWEMEPKIYRTSSKENSRPSWWLWTILGLGLVLIAAFLSIFYMLVLKKHLNRKKSDILKMNLHNGYLTYSTYDEIKEICKKIPKVEIQNLKIVKKISSGTFGNIYEGKLVSQNNQETRIACKALKESNFMNTDLINEAIMLSKLKGHRNIIHLYGICFEQDEPKYLVFECADLGDLLEYLRKNRFNNSIDYKKVLEICMDIVEGCVYLENNRIVHRDLAARNCLIFSSNDDRKSVKVKISDFGLSREINLYESYKFTGQKPLPVRWMSPESIIDNIATSQSDVYSFGVLLYEILTLGNQPFPGLSNSDVIEYIKKGGTPECKYECPEELSNIMLSCWKRDPIKRPNFKAILDALKKEYKRNDQLRWKVNPIFNQSQPIETDKIEASEPLLKPENVETYCNNQLSFDSAYRSSASKAPNNHHSIKGRLWSINSEGFSES